jgi:hypothetical protein
MKIALLFFILALSLIISTLCYDFYTTAKVNRFKFRHWFSVGILNSFVVVLAMYFEVTGSTHFQDVRWATFAMMEILFLEIFINQYSFLHRRNELLVRVIYYWAVLISPILMYATLNVFISIVLIWLAFTGNCVNGKWFGWSFILYGLTTIIPEIFGYGTIQSFLIGVIFTTHLFVGVYKLYKLELKKEIDDGH